MSLQGILPYIKQRRGGAFVFFRASVLLLIIIIVSSIFLVPSSLPQYSSTRNTVGNESELLLGINLLEQSPVRHHSVMSHVPRSAVPFDPSYIAEPGVLWIPAHFDCANIAEEFWGTYTYYSAVPSRWIACDMYAAVKRSGVPWVVPQLPVIDDEYFEHVAVYDSALRAKKRFVFAEIGARWGTWGFRGVALLRAVNPMPYRFWAVEADPKQCVGIPQVADKNGIIVESTCRKASAKEIIAFIDSESTVDVIDIDIQGAESVILSDKNLRNLVDKRVKRLIIGTHSPEIHATMSAMFKHWHTQIDIPHTTDGDCVNRFMRSENKGNRSKYTALVNKGCYRKTTFGKIANYDGELILDNPRFYQGPPLFPEEFQPARK